MACQSCPEIHVEAPTRAELTTPTPLFKTDRFDGWCDTQGVIWANKKGNPDYFWVPRVEECIWLLKQKHFSTFGQMADLKLDVFMKASVSKIYCHSGQTALTFNEMWLVFFMQHTHNKMWARDREEWNPI